MSEKLPLLFVTKEGRKVAYTRPGYSRTIPPYKYADKVTHANDIIKQFDDVLSQHKQHEVLRISVNGSCGREFPLDSLEKSGMRVLNFLQDGQGRQEATVLMGKGAPRCLKSKIEAYRDKLTKKGGISHQKLVGRIDSITRPRSLWYWRDQTETLSPENEIWIEIWLSIDQSISQAKERFEKNCRSCGIIFNDKPLEFCECIIYAVYANKTKIESLIAIEPLVFQCRALRAITTEIIDAAPSEQKDWTTDLLRRMVKPEGDAPSVCILDSGCNKHPIIEPLIREGALISAVDGKPAYDILGHGTQMAGVAAYGNLNHAMMNHNGKVFPHAIESCRLYGLSDTERLHGEITLQAVSRMEIARPRDKRVFCMALTEPDHSAKLTGHPTSWSAALDLATSNPSEQGEYDRLFLVSAGNRNEIVQNDEFNEDAAVQNPAQAWNIVTVGAVTHLTDMPDNYPYKPYEIYAQAGELSPYSTYSLKWKAKAPIKPEVLCEGGNAVIVRRGGMSDIPEPVSDEPETMSLVAPYWKHLERPYDLFKKTSLSTALATNIAAGIMREYPNLRAETIRGLIVHSAEWTQEMLDKYLRDSNTKSAYLHLARMCGFGEASLSRAIECKTNHLTLVHEGTLRPYKRKGSQQCSYNEMAYHRLPWPKSALKSIGNQQVVLKVTLSYFVEPNPRATEDMERIYSYPSYSLRYSIKKCTDTFEQHIKKLNRATRDEGETVQNQGQYDGWKLGSYAFVGSVHSDIWEGTADELAEMEGIAISPDTGWWKSRPGLKKYDSIAHYSLIVSIRTKDNTCNVDLYTEVKNQIEASIQATNDISVEL